MSKKCSGRGFDNKYDNPLMDLNDLDPNFIHTPKGIRRMAARAKSILMHYYQDLVLGMFEYDFNNDEKFDVLYINGMGEIPEKYLLNRGRCCWFKHKGQILCTPMNTVFNFDLYAQPAEWSPFPDCGLRGEGKEIAKLKLDHSNSVIMRNLPYAWTDLLAINLYTDRMISAMLTVNQRIFLFRAPYFFVGNNKTQAQTAAEIMEGIMRNVPAIVINKNAPLPQILTANVDLDPGILEITQDIECRLLSQLGIPYTDVHKRAQQSVPETNMNLDKVYLRLRNKWRERDRAIKLINKMFETSIKVRCVIDSKIGINDINSIENPQEMEDNVGSNGERQ